MDGLDDDDLSMDADESPAPRPRPRADKPMISDSDDDDHGNSDEGNSSQSQSKPASRPVSPASSTSSQGQTRARAEPPTPVVLRHEVDMPAACPRLGSQKHYVKLPNFLSIGTHEYDPLYYEDEIDDDEGRDYEGRAKLKLRVENTIRWRKTRGDDGTEKVESNTRLVEWSDGTMSLYLGSEIFDINVKDIGENSQLFIRLGQAAGLQAQAIFKTKLSIRPNSTESFTHRKLTLSLADRSQKTQKIRMLNNPGQDPEARLHELSKNEDDKLKATMRRETKQRRIQERSQSSGPNAAYLEDYDEEDDEDGSISLSAIKRNALARKKHNYSDEDDESDEVYSDDSDPEFGKERRTERKKKQVVEDSDDDE